MMNFLDQYVESLKPGLQRVGVAADSFRAEILRELRGIRHAVEDDTTRRAQFRRWPASAITNGGGTVDLPFEVPLGKCVRLISVTGTGTAAGAGIDVGVYSGNADDEANLLLVPTYAQRFHTGFPDGSYVGPGERITVRFRTQSAGQRVTAMLNVQLLPADHPERGITGDTEPRGNVGQQVAEPERHFATAIIGEED